MEIEEKYLINFSVRNHENNTHTSIIDECIEKISAHQFKYPQRIIYIVLNFLFIGLFSLISLFSIKFYVKFNLKPCFPQDANYILVECKDGTLWLCNIKRENFFENCLTIKNIKKEFITPQSEPEKPSIIFEFRGQKYEYIENKFHPIFFDLSLFSIDQIHELFSDGLTDRNEYLYLSKKYGKNIIKMKSKSFFYIFFELILQPNFLYQIFCIVIWILDQYYYFTIIVLLFNILFFALLSYQKLMNYRKFLNYSLYLSTSIIRKDGQNENLSDSTVIVPGDIIEIQSDDTVPCDGIILEGFCNVDESDITGENTLVIKTPLYNEKKPFNYKKNRHSILYLGTKVSKCQSKKEKNTVTILAINTGYNTYRGNMIQNLLLKKESQFSIHKDFLILYIYAFISFVIYLVAYFYFNFHVTFGYPCQDLKFKFNTSNIILDILLCIPRVYPPTLFISLLFTSFYFQRKLKKHEISCISNNSMTIAGKVNVLIFDKTGTLTEEGVELEGFMPTKTLSYGERKIIEFDEIEKTSTILNEVHRDFWYKFNIFRNHEVFKDYERSPNFNLVYFVEGLASCHSINYINGETIENSVDKIIHRSLGWKISKSEANSNEFKFKFDMIPENCYEIPSDLAFNKDINSDLRTYRVSIVKRFDFSSKFQSNSVIVKNQLDEKFRFYIKGAPEKIIKICKESSLPKDFQNHLLKQTQKGNRVLAYATKPLNISSEKDIKGKKREYYENDLIFLGLIIFKNKLKSDTKCIINQIRSSKINLIMNTGDNPFTSISVAKECNLVDGDKDIFFCDIEKDKTGRNRLKWSNIRINSKSNFRLKTLIPPFKLRFNPEDENIEIANKSLSQESVNKRENDGSNTARVLINQEVSNTEFLSHQKNDVEKNKSQISKNDETEYLTDIDKFAKMAFEDDNIILCYTGKSFKFMVENSGLTRKGFKDLDLVPNIKSAYENLAKATLKRGKIFTRMDPDDKVNLVEFFKRNKYIVAMCGDGSNDCGALLSADIGIALASREISSVTSHFYANSTSISCVLFILRNGSACFENSIIILKFLITFGAIENTLFLIYNSKKIAMITNDFLLYIHLFVLFSCILVSRTGSNKNLKFNDIGDRKYTAMVVFSVTGQIIFNATFMYFAFYFLEKSLDLCELGSDNKFLKIIDSCMVIFNLFQYGISLFSFNLFAEQRKEFYTNKLLIFVYSLLLFVIYSFISFPFDGAMIKFFNFSVEIQRSDHMPQNEYFKIVLLLVGIANFFVLVTYQIFLQKAFLSFRNNKK